MKSALFFDLDETIISTSSEKEFLKYLYKKGMISGSNLLRIARLFAMHKLYLIRDYTEAKKKAARLLLKNKNYEETISLYDDFFRTHLVNKIYPAVYEVIRLHKEKKHEIYIISASLDFIVEKFCSHLGATRYFAVQPEVKDNVFTGEIPGTVMFSQEKTNIIKMLSDTRDISLEHSHAFSDSFLDIPMLSMVGNPVAVNPDKKLSREAKKKNWSILKWKECQ